MDNEWAYGFKNKMFTIFKTKFNNKFKSTYSGLLITTDEEKLGKIDLPTVLFRQIGMPEAGQDLEGKSINAIRPTFQISIYLKGNRNELETLLYYAMEIFKSKSFQISDPMPSESDGVQIATFRATRIVGANDSI